VKVCAFCNERFETIDWQCPSCRNAPKLIEGFQAFSPESIGSSDGFKSDYFAKLADLEVENFWFRSRNRLIVWALTHYFPNVKTFFEIGCGTGFVLSGIRQEFPELILYGSDLFLNGLAFAEQRVPDASFFQLDARLIPFECEFDVIGAFDMLEHIHEDVNVLHQMFQATRPGGGVILTVPQHPFLWSALDDYSFHKRRYTRKELVQKVQCAGFEVIRLTSFVSFLLPAMLLSRIKIGRSPESSLPEIEFNISRSLNSIFERVLGIERTLIKHGFSFPAGGSLLLIGSRARG
jgi:SAM-dependent methyltransferase